MTTANSPRSSKLACMDWEELHTNLPSLMTFLTVARLGRFTAAADSLGINHATVSRRISGLEKITGQRLLLRSQSGWEDRKSTRLNSSHVAISYAVFCLKQKIRRNDAVGGAQLPLSYCSGS